jgi:uncharacterized protein
MRRDGERPPMCTMTRVLPTRDSVLDDITSRIVGRFDPDKVLLFGSRARGDFRPESDYDLLVVLDHCPDRRSTAVAMRNALADLLVSKDVIVAESAQLNGTARCSELVRSALREGRVLYERR